MKIKILLIIGLLNMVSCTFFVKEQPPITVIPEPQAYNFIEGEFILAEELKIFSDRKTDERKFAIGQLIDEVDTDLRLVESVDDAQIIIRLFDNNSKKPSEKIGSQGYSLEITNDKIMLQANTETGIFYGIQTLKQLYRTRKNINSLECLEILDWPGLEYRGWQDDISRGPIPTLDFLKRQVEIMAEYKQNIFTLYTEHVFKLNKHPKIAPDDGITADEVKELVEFAKNYHINVIGNFQSFGHFEHILKVPEYSHLGETEAGWVLSPAFEESYAFLKDAYDEIAPVYESEFFNINCDETWGLGQGASADMVDSMGLDGVYAYHINRINDLLKPHKKRVMMWGDIAVKNPGIIKQLPKDLIVLSWGYGPEDSFDEEIVPFTESGFDFLVCPGVGCWSKIWPEYSSAIVNISNYIRDGFHHGAKGVLNTTWDDDGENLFNYNWYPLLWGAEVGWKPVDYKDRIGKEMALRLEKFKNKFSPVFFSNPNPGMTEILIDLSQLGQYSASRNLQNSRFWKSISEVALTKHSEESKTESLELSEKCNAILQNINALDYSIIHNADILDYAKFAVERVKLIAEKERLGIEMSKALYNDGDMETFKAKLGILAGKVMELREDYKKLWLQENRNWWLDTNLVKFDEQSEDLKRSYLNVLIQPQVGKFAGNVQIELKKMFNGGDIYYTLDGSEPDNNSMLYTKPFNLDKETMIRAIGWLNNSPGRENRKTVYPHLALGKEISLTYPYHANYSGGGTDGLVNGEFGSGNFRDGKWQGYEGVDLEAVIDLGGSIEISEISTRFLQAVGSWIFQPEQVKISISSDNKNFELVDCFEFKIHKEMAHNLIQDYQTDVNKKARYIKVFGKNIRNCPDWHVGQQGKAWVFIDEIVVK